MFTIEKTGPDGNRPRIVAEEVLSEADFRAAARALGTGAVRARKTGLIAARQAARRESIETQWNGSETTNTAEPGDWIITSLSASGKVLRDAAGHANSYVIRAGSFPAMYKAVDGGNEFGRFHAATGTVDALHLTGGFDIMGPWGQRQTAPDGYLVLNRGEVYGNNAETFDASFEVIG